MRKVKLHLVAVALIAIASAFVAPKLANDDVAKLGPNTFVPINMALEGHAVPGGWECATASDTCRYKTKAGVPSGKPSYTRAEVDPVLTTTSKKFQWIIPPTP